MSAALQEQARKYALETEARGAARNAEAVNAQHYLARLKFEHDNELNRFKEELEKQKV